MFIKILTPNHNGKIELTVRDLEALIQEAVDKAIVEDRANRPIQFWYDNGDVNRIDTNPNWDWTKITCNDNKNATLLNQSKEGKMTFMDAVNDIIGEQMK